jgi:DNA-binding NarL/FixJ family response regulator
MGKKILIAEPREVIRTGLCTVFQKDISVSEVKDISTGEELKKHLCSLDFDLAVISQTLITDMKLLPPGRFILLTDEPDLSILTAAYEHQALGYLSVNVTTDLLRVILHSNRDGFLIDPTLLPWMMELISENRKRTDILQLLSPREREVVTLLDEGLDRRTIATQLHISEATLKTHIKNIARKYDDAKWSQKILVYQRHLKGMGRKGRLSDTDGRQGRLAN